MIKTREDVRYYQKMDFENELKHGDGRGKSKIKNLLNPRLRFVRNLRKLEYHTNNSGNQRGHYTYQ